MLVTMNKYKRIRRINVMIVSIAMFFYNSLNWAYKVCLPMNIEDLALQLACKNYIIQGSHLFSILEIAGFMNKAGGNALRLS